MRFYRGINEFGWVLGIDGDKVVTKSKTTSETADIGTVDIVNNN
jgi:hypothetical protein